MTRHATGYEALVQAVGRVLPLPETVQGRPRLPTDDSRLARRRAQYRNAKRKAAGLPPEPLPPTQRKPYVRKWPRKVTVLTGDGWVKALVYEDGRRVFE